MSASTSTERKPKPRSRRRRALTIAAATGLLLAGPQAAMAHAATLGSPAAAVTINTDGVSDLLSKNFLPLAVLFIGILIVASGRKKDISSSLTMTGITLLGLGVVGMSLSAAGVGTAMFSLFTNGG
jgi:hypothetical protein